MRIPRSTTAILSGTFGLSAPYRKALLLSGSVFVVICLVYFGHYKILSAASFETYRNASLPDGASIIKYVSNKNFVIDHPPIGNSVYYNAADGRYFEWHDDFVYNGRWWVSSRILPLHSKDGLSFKYVALFCRTLTVSDGADCIVVTNLSSILSYGTVSVYNGDIFSLYDHYSPPFTMPTTNIDAKILENKMSKNRSLN